MNLKSLHWAARWNDQRPAQLGGATFGAIWDDTSLAVQRKMNSKMCTEHDWRPEHRVRGRPNHERRAAAPASKAREQTPSSRAHRRRGSGSGSGAATRAAEAASTRLDAEYVVGAS